MDISRLERLVGLAIDAGVVLAFGCVLVGAGHGVAPIGLLMFVGGPGVWGLPMAVGWVGLALLAISVLVSRRGLYLSLALAGLATLVASWWLFISQSASVVSSLVFSIPFLGALAGRLVYLMVRLRGGRA